MRRCSPLLVLCLVCATLVLADPAGSDVVMTVTPDSDLSSGDVVTIEASGFPPTNIFFCEVLIALAPAPESCGAPTFVGSTDGSGNFAAKYSVQRFVAPQLMPQVDCVVVACGIAVADVGDVEGTMVIAPISFRPGPVPRPDAILKKRTVELQLVGDNVYENHAAGGTQTLGHPIVPGDTWSFALRMQNDGEATDDLRVKPDIPTGVDTNGPLSLRIFVGYFDVTALVFGGGFVFQDVAVGETRKMAVQFRAGPAATSGDFIVLRLALSSEAAPEVQDAVRVSVRVF